MTRVTKEQLEQALRDANGSIADAARLLSERGTPITRGHATVLVRRMGLTVFGQELRAAVETQKPPMPPKHLRCKWGGCRTPKVTQVFCKDHAERHAALGKKKVADRKSRKVCIVCEGSLAEGNTRLCKPHLAMEREARSKRVAAGKRG